MAAGKIGVLYVTVHSAAGLPDMDSWGGGHSDPYVLTYLDGEQQSRTETIDDTGDPVWNQALTIDVYGAPSELTFKIWDDDSFRADSEIGGSKIPLGQILGGSKLSKAQLPIRNQDGRIDGATLKVSVSFIKTASSWEPTDTGSRKALMIGINYVTMEKGKGRLAGCVNDVDNMKELITGSFGYSDIKVYHDELPDEGDWPTKRNIMAGIEWLTSGAKAGDQLWFHFSGHGTQVADKTGDEGDGKDEAMVPCDFRKSGLIVDDELKKHLVDSLPSGVRLTCIMDCCHSGTGMDLPFERVVYETSDDDFNTHSSEVYSSAEDKASSSKYHSATTKKKLKAKVNGWSKHGGHGATGTAVTMDGVEGGQMKDGHQLMDSADVLLISGCMDSQTPADAHIGGESTGAMSFSLKKIIEDNGSDISTAHLVVEMRKLLEERKYTQVPQLSTLRPFDLSAKFHP
jgi:hypothetical protein